MMHADGRQATAGGRKEIYIFLFFFPRISTGPIKGPAAGDIPWI